MKFSTELLTFLCLVAPSAISAFSPASVSSTRRTTFVSRNILKDDDSLEQALDRQMEYKPGQANSEFAKRFGSLAGQEVKTVGEAFAEFTELLGHPINALYKNVMTDIVGTAHLTVVNARFQRDGIWSLGFLASMDLLLKNYPEKEISGEIIVALAKCIDMDIDEIKAEAKVISDWVEGKSEEEVRSALNGEGDSPIATIAKAAKDDEFWMYSRFFGVGLVDIMNRLGMNVDMETSYTKIEDWVGTAMGKPYYTACSDSDLFFKTKEKLDMMETLMKEVEIREKKRMAQRLEEKAEMALAKAEREAELKKVIAEEEQKEKAGAFFADEE